MTKKSQTIGEAAAAAENVFLAPFKELAERERDERVATAAERAAILDEAETVAGFNEIFGENLKCPGRPDCEICTAIDDAVEREDLNRLSDTIDVCTEIEARLDEIEQQRLNALAWRDHFAREIREANDEALAKAHLGTHAQEEVRSYDPQAARKRGYEILRRVYAEKTQAGPDDSVPEDLDNEERGIRAGNAARAAMRVTDALNADILAARRAREKEERDQLTYGLAILIVCGVVVWFFSSLFPGVG